MKPRNLEGEYAGFVSRAVGLFLDYAIVLVLMAVFGLLTYVLFRAVGVQLLSCEADAAASSIAAVACTGGRLFVVLGSILTTPIYYVLLWALVGQTFGQRLMGVRVVRLDGHNIGVARGVLRLLGYQLCLATFGIGFLWVLVDDRRMGWHDKIAHTCVVYSWKAVQNDRLIDKVNAFFGRKRAE